MPIGVVAGTRIRIPRAQAPRTGPGTVSSAEAAGCEVPGVDAEEAANEVKESKEG